MGNEFDEVLEGLHAPEGECENVMEKLYLELFKAEEKRNKRNFITVVMLVAFILLNNLAWIWHISQYDYGDITESIEYEMIDGTENEIDVQLGDN